MKGYMEERDPEFDNWLQSFYSSFLNLASEENEFMAYEAYKLGKQQNLREQIDTIAKPMVEIARLRIQIETALRKLRLAMAHSNPSIIGNLIVEAEKVLSEKR